MSFRLLLLLAVTIVCQGCACESFLAPNLNVEVRDAATNAAAARGATGIAEVRGGPTTDLRAVDSLRMFGNWDRERPGHYTVRVRKPGYLEARAETRVEEDGCHVRTRRIALLLQRDTNAVSESPIALRLGAHMRGTTSATVRALGDTLQIVGASDAACTDLTIVAFRNRSQWHIQLEPAKWPDGTCRTLDLQQFEVRYRMVSGQNNVLLTNAVGFESVVLFDGFVESR